MNKFALLAAAAAIALPSAGNAGVIVAPVSAVIDVGGPGFGSIADTFNQAGLRTPYVNGVTDFATYIAGVPKHDWVFAGNEWFSDSGTTTATVTFDMGAVGLYAGMALWNEDASGMGSYDILGSIDGSIFFTLAAGVIPTNNAHSVDYGPDTIGGSPVSVRFFRLIMKDCPEVGGTFDACALGEIAFDRVGVVPEPAAWGMMLAGFILVGGALRRRAKLSVAYA